MNNRDYIKQWSRFQLRYERKYIAAIRKILNNQVRQWVENKSVDYKELSGLLTSLYITTGVQWAARVHRTLPKSKARLPMGINERVIELMREALGLNIEILSQSITQTTMEYITQVFQRGFELGWSIDKMVKEMGLINAKRARVIARTETVSAANEAGFRYAESFGYNMRKTWLAVGDRRTRDTHRTVSGTTLNMDTPFNVGGQRMMQPGARKQPDGSPVDAKEVVQCRCVLAYKVI